MGIRYNTIMQNVIIYSVIMYSGVLYSWIMYSVIMYSGSQSASWGDSYLTVPPALWILIRSS